MRTIHQRWSNDCSLAAVCMVTGLPYRKVRKVAKHHLGFSRRVMEGVAVGDLLEELGFYYELVSGFPLSAPAIVVVPSRFEGAPWHAVAWDGKKIRDPSSMRKTTETMARSSALEAYVNIERVI